MYFQKDKKMNNNNSIGENSTGENSTGHFSTIDGEYTMFNKPCTKKEYHAHKPEWLFFDITDWIEEGKMTELEKNIYPTHKTTGGYLKVISYQEAAQQSWLSTTQEDR